MTNYYGYFYFVCVLLGRLKAGLRVVVSRSRQLTGWRALRPRALGGWNQIGDRLIDQTGHELTILI